MCLLPLLRLSAPSSVRSFVCPLLRLSAPSSVRSFVALLLLIFSLFLPPVHAQTGGGAWVLDHYACAGTTTYGGGTYTWPTSAPPGSQYDYTGTLDSFFGQGSGVSFGTSNINGPVKKVSGTISPVFVWSGPNGAPAGTVNVLLQARADGTGSASNANDGLGDVAIVGEGNQSQGLHLVTVSVSAGQKSFTLSSPISLLGSDPGGWYYAGVYLIAYAVDLNLPGTTPDSSGNLHILIGQSCPASLSAAGTPAPPVSSFTLSNLQWKATGNTVQGNSWVVASGDSSATFSGLVNPYTYTQATPQAAGPSWYWDDSTTSQSVTCTATVTPPAGQGAAFTVTATQKVTLDAPTYVPHDYPGVVKLDADYQAQSGLNLHAGGGSDNIPGIYFKDTVTTPNLSIYGGTGTWYRVQLVSVNRNEYATGSTTPSGAPGNSVTGALDVTHLQNGGVSIVYNNQIIQADGSTFDPNHNTTAENDSPGFPVLDTYQEYKVTNETYTDYILYHPPGSNSIDVPLFSYSWSWNADVTIPSTPLPKSWANWKGAPTGGTITPPTAATRQLKYPTWTALNNADLP